MRVNFAAILTVEAAIKAVEQNSDALRYVLSLKLFIAIAAKFKITTNVMPHK